MQKQAPTLGRVMVMAIFALSCFSLLLFLWSAFGGPVPLKPHGYRFEASFLEATQLAAEADVRISGVSVGKVKKIELADDGRSDATIELRQEFAPLPADTRAILRQKTLLGEIYVELTPGSAKVDALPEDGRLANTNIAPTVELDEILRSFDAKTQAGFRTWFTQLGLGVNRRGQDFNDLIAALPDFSQTTNRLVTVLNSQKRATRELIKNTGVVFDALSERDGQLSELIVNSNRVFEATASRDEQLAATFRNFPRFIDESELVLDRLVEFAGNANPVLVDLRPVGTNLSKVLVNTSKFAVDFKGLFVGLNRLVRVARKGLPAASRFLDDVAALLTELDPFLRNLNPLLEYLELDKRELNSFFANFAAATQAKSNAGVDAGVAQYLRLIPSLVPEGLSIYPQRLGSNRTNPYTSPGGYEKLAQGLDSFNTNLCGVGGFPDLAPAPAGDAAAEDLRARVLKFILNGQGDPATPTTTAAPCNKQNPFNFGGVTTDYPHVNEDPKPSNPFSILSP